MKKKIYIYFWDDEIIIFQVKEKTLLAFIYKKKSHKSDNPINNLKLTAPSFLKKYIINAF